MIDSRPIVRYDVSRACSCTRSQRLSYVYLLLTGLAFWTPALYWLAIVLGGGYLSRLLHPWVGLVFTRAVVWMYVTWRRDMKTTPEDRAWRKAMRHYIRNEDDEVPPAGRFNFGQKMLFWVMVARRPGAAALGPGALVRGRDSVGASRAPLRGDARPRRRGALTIGGFIVHVYMGLAVVPGGLSAIVHGTFHRSGRGIIIRSGFRASVEIAPESNPGAHLCRAAVVPRAGAITGQ